MPTQILPEYEAAKRFGTKTLNQPPEGVPFNQIHADAAKKFCEEQDTWSAAQQAVATISNHNAAALDVPHANRVKGRLKRAGIGSLELKFIDREGIDRSAGSKLRIPTRVHNKRDDAAERSEQAAHKVHGRIPIYQYNPDSKSASPEYIRAQKLGMDHSLLGSQVRLSYRPMFPETRKLLEAYIRGDSYEFADIFLRQDSESGRSQRPTTRDIMTDLKRLSQGPLFNMVATKTILDGIYARLAHGVNQDAALFQVGVEVLTNNLLTNMFEAHRVRQKYTVKHIKSREIDRKVPRQTKEIFDTFASPTGLTIEEDVYRQALTVSLVAEACIKATQEVDSANQRHVKHVALGVGYAVAGLKAILTLAPTMKVGDAVANFFDPIQNTIVHKVSKKYTSSNAANIVENELAAISSDAESGFIVPGLNNAPEVRARYHHTVGEDPVTKLVHEERKLWGKFFNEQVALIRPLARRRDPQQLRPAATEQSEQQNQEPRVPTPTVLADKAAETAESADK